MHLGHRPVVVKHALDLGRDVLAIDYGGVKLRDGRGTPEGDDSLKSRPEEELIRRYLHSHGSKHAKQLLSARHPQKVLTK